MQKLNIVLDMDDNEVLSKEIEKAIEGAVKAKTRGFFHEEIEKELKRITFAEFERLMEKGGYYRSQSVLEKQVKELLDKKLTEAIGEVSVSRDDVKKRIDERLKEVDAIIDSAVSARVGNLDIERYIKEKTADTVRRLYPQKIIRLIEQKEIEELRQRVRELESENKALRAGKREE